MAVRVDEAGDDDAAADVDLPRAPVIAAHADDAVAAEGDVAFDEFAGDEIEDAPALEDEIGGRDRRAPERWRGRGIRAWRTPVWR